MKESENATAPEGAENPAEDTNAEAGRAAAEEAPPAKTADGETPDEADGGKTGSAPAEDEKPDEAAVWKDRFARLQADFDNFRKRQAREYAERVNQANADLIDDLLPALDQFDRGLDDLEKRFADDADNPYLSGYRMARDTLLAALARHGLEPVPSTVDAPLDTETTEALTVMATGMHRPGCVAFETRRGYRLNGRVLRAAQAVVEKEEEKPAAPASENSPEEK